VIGNLSAKHRFAVLSAAADPGFSHPQVFTAPQEETPMQKTVLSALAGFIAMVISATAYAVHVDLGPASVSGVHAPAHSQRAL
jgi:hypothetical protein